LLASRARLRFARQKALYAQGKPTEHPTFG
jgi:hypothetical protein